MELFCTALGAYLNTNPAAQSQAQAKAQALAAAQGGQVSPLHNEHTLAMLIIAMHCVLLLCR